MMKYLSIDAGGTFIKYAWMDEDGYILQQGKSQHLIHQKKIL